MASEIRNRFTDTEMQIARETDLPELLSHLGYQVKRVGRFHTTAEMDSLRIKDRRTWFRYSQNTGGDAITFLDRKSTRLNSSHMPKSRMPSSA